MRDIPKPRSVEFLEVVLEALKQKLINKNEKLRRKNDNGKKRDILLRSR